MAIEIAGENSLIVYLDQGDLTQRNAQVRALTQALQQRRPRWLVDVIPSYASVLVIFDLAQTDYLAVKGFIKSITLTNLHHVQAQGIEHDLPVWYGAKGANDLTLIAQHTGLSEPQIIALHQSQAYQVFAIGFAPGFAFLGELDPALATPRLRTPRTQVPKGAVAIADQQTAVYPNASPGGWHILGLCPLPLFDAESQPPMALKVGDKVRFYAIDEAQFASMEERQ